MSILFHTEDLNFRFNRKRITRNKLIQLIGSEGYEAGDINVIFCSDDYLLEVNKQYLNHDFYTDIITFDYTNEESISGDLFISIDRVKENAATNNIPFDHELLRVIFHGVLHLCGYNDKSPQEKKLMRAKEDYYLNLN